VDVLELGFGFGSTFEPTSARRLRAVGPRLPGSRLGDRFVRDGRVLAAMFSLETPQPGAWHGGHTGVTAAFR
jgi:hypothetical protein